MGTKNRNKSSGGRGRASTNNTASPKACAPQGGGPGCGGSEQKDNYGNHALAQLPLANPIHSMFAARFMYLYTAATPPAWTITPYSGFDVNSGYIQVPIAASAAFGFDAATPNEGDAVVIGTYIIDPSVVPYVSALPPAVTASLYSVRFIPTASNPFYVLKPFNTSAGCEGWEANDMIFVQYGPYYGGRPIVQIGDGTQPLIGFFGPNQVSALIRLRNFMIAPCAAPCGPNGLRPEFSDYGDSGSSGSDNSSDCSSDITGPSFGSSSSGSSGSGGNKRPPHRPQPPRNAPPGKGPYAPINVFGRGDGSGSDRESSGSYSSSN